MVVVILDRNETILEFIDDSEVTIEIDDTYKGYKSLTYECQLTDVLKQKNLYKQGNKILTEDCLFVINTEVEEDYIKNIISLEAEELIYELNNCNPFYIKDPLFAPYVSGNSIKLSFLFLKRLVAGFYTMDKTDLDTLDDSLKLITVNGTITKYDLLKEIEDTTGLVFKREYCLEGNKILKKLSLVTVENYGVTHSKLLESVTLGDNTNKLAYSTDETKNALGIMPIVTSEDSDNVNYTRILEQFNNLDINNANILPYYAEYEFSTDDIVDCATRLSQKIGLWGYLPEKFTISHEEIYNKEDYGYSDGDAYNNDWITNKIYNVEPGMGQLLDLFTAYLVNKNIGASGNLHLKVVTIPAYVTHSAINNVFNSTDILDIAKRVQEYISLSGSCPGTLSTRHGLLSFQLIMYIITSHISDNGSVYVNTSELALLNGVLPDFVEEETRYIVEYENLEHMPYLYTQNTSDSSSIPTQTPSNIENTNIREITNYISESYPVLVVTKENGASQILIKVFSQGIADDNQKSFLVNFKDPSLVKDGTDITIDFSKKEIKYTKYYQVETTVEKEVTETVETENSGVITVTGKNTCGCCGYPKMAYKNYTRTFKDYCPACGRSGTLVFNPKGVVDGEVTCGNTGPACKNGGTKNGTSYKKGSIKGCDADYCCQCGGDKWGSGRCKNRKLTQAEATTSETVTKKVTETQLEWKEVEVTANLEETGESDNREALYDVITEQSTFEAFYGDCSMTLTGCTFKSLNCDSTKLFEMSPFPYIKNKGQQYIYAPVTRAGFNYTHMTNNSPKLEPFETSEQSVEEVLIGCWKKLNGSGDSTAWLEKSEDINVDLVESYDTTYNVGDFVYIKLPDTLVFKAQIISKSYNPKLKGDSSLKIGNITRESII